MTPVDMSVWTGRTDPEEGPEARRWHEVVEPLDASSGAGVVLLGFACDEGVRRNAGRVGARDGPRALRQALAGLAAHQARTVIDAGDVTCDDGDLESAQAAFGGRIESLLDAGHFPVGLGGGHEIAYGTFIGLARHLEKQPGPPESIGIVNLDAHFDLRKASRPNSGTSFLRMAEYCREQGQPFHYCCLGISEPSNTAALFDRANELGVTWRADDRMGACQLPETLQVLREFAGNVSRLYLTICLDVLPEATAPGVSAPAAHGVSLEVIEALVHEAKDTGKLTAADVAELNPRLDQENRTTKVAARLVYQIIR